MQVNAQRFKITGQVADSLSGGLPSVTVMLLNKSDSTLAAFAAGTFEGRFELKAPNPGPFIVKIVYTGYLPWFKTVEKPLDSEVYDLGKINLPLANKELKEVMIEGERVPVVIKQDTIEFDAQSFTVVPNANVEDLLKKLPGVEVDREGNVTAQGKQVQRVMVDGKDFFGGRDPKLATKNLPADAISKVQVFEKKSETADFTGIDDGVREQTINLELKEEKRNGSFGKVEAGIGNDERYRLRGNLNKFSKGNQLSFLGQSNNINEQGFSIQDYINFSGNAAALGGGGRRNLNLGSGASNLINNGQRQNGIMENYAGGINLNRQLSAKTELNASYLYNQLNHFIETDLQRDNFLPSGNFALTDKTVQNNSNYNHRLSASLDHKVDSMNSLKFTTNISYNQTLSNSSSNAETVGSETGVRQNTGLRDTEAEGYTLNANNNLLWRHKFAKRGRSLTTNVILNVTDRTRDTELNALNTFGPQSEVSLTTRQSNVTTGSTLSTGGTITYTEPIARRLYWETNYTYTHNENISNQDVRNTDSLGIERVNPQLTNKFNSTYRYHKPGMNLRLNRTKYNASIGVSLQETNLYGFLPLRDTKINRSFTNVLPIARFNYDFSSSRRLNFDYETSVQEPSITDLQPIVDNTDPLNISTGNPDLKPAYRHNFRTNYFFFNPVTFMAFFVSGNYTYETNAIVTSQEVDERLVRTTKPVNVGENTRAFANANLSFPIKSINSRLRIGTNAVQTTGLNLLNNQENRINTTALTGTLRYQFNYKEIFEQNLGYQLTRQDSRFSFGSPNQLFLNSSYTASSILRVKKKNILNAELDYLVYENPNNNFYQELPLLNITLSRLMLKNDRGELKVSVNNLLNRDLGITQNADVNFIETTRINNLGRFFMVSFVYSINKHLDMMNDRGASRMFRIMR